METTVELMSKYAGVFLLLTHTTLLFVVIFLAYRKKLSVYAGVLAVVVVLFEVLSAVILTVLQYIVWDTSPATYALVSEPLQNSNVLFWIHAPVQAFVTGTHGYYILYAYTHFWLNTLLAFSVGLFAIAATYCLHRIHPLSISIPSVLLSGVLAIILVRLMQML